jgi:hypothetical protein
VWLFPWSFFLPLAVSNLYRRLKPAKAAPETQKQEVAEATRARVSLWSSLGSLNREGKTLLFLSLWAVLIILFFSFSTTQEYYTMPSYAAFALLIGHALSRVESEWREGQSKKLLLGAQIALAVLGVAVFVIGMMAYLKTRNLSVAADISDTLTRNPDAYALSLGHVLDLTPQTLALLRAPVVGTALAFLLGSVAALGFRLRARHTLANLSLAVMMAALFFFTHQALAVFAPYLSSRPLAEAIAREYKEGEVIVINGEYEGGSSINFYTRKMVHILNGRSANLEYGSYFKDAPQIFLGHDDLARMWNGPARIFLFTDAAQREAVTSHLSGAVFTFAESGGKLILTNQQSNKP